MGMMLNKILSDPKRIVILALVALIVLFICAVALIGGGWTIFHQSEPTPTAEPVSFGYCGAEFIDLCVVSFGRDAFGNTVINLYVPIRRYPVFYLEVIRQSGKQRFECKWNLDVKTSVYCTGSPLNLGEGFNIHIFSEEDNFLLAEGEFTLIAFRVTTPVVGGSDSVSTPNINIESTPSIAADNNSTPFETGTATATLTASGDIVETETLTPQSSYPSYP